MWLRCDSVGRGYAIYRGITTGFNDAFIIDNQTKEALVTQDSRSEEVIKPVLRGRDIYRYPGKVGQHVAYRHA